MLDVKMLGLGPEYALSHVTNHGAEADEKGHYKCSFCHRWMDLKTINDQLCTTRLVKALSPAEKMALAIRAPLDMLLESHIAVLQMLTMLPPVAVEFGATPAEWAFYQMHRLQKELYGEFGIGEILGILAKRAGGELFVSSLIDGHYAATINRTNVENQNGQYMIAHVVAHQVLQGLSQEEVETIELAQVPGSKPVDPEPGDDEPPPS